MAWTAEQMAQKRAKLQKKPMPLLVGQNPSVSARALTAATR